jgi:deoxyguanosinetriphosphate triphosphohydrolase, putative
LSETLALAHDLGHTPFGHAGEDALNEVTLPWGGFNHNAQTLKILTNLEHRYAGFDGLNLTWETLEGVIKHNGPLIHLLNQDNNLSRIIIGFNKKYNLKIDTYPSLEAQIASLSDDIAYNNHDIDDGLRAGLFTVNDLMDIPIIGNVVNEVINLYGDNLEKSRLYNEIVRRTINAMVVDLITQTKIKLEDSEIRNVEDIRNSTNMIASFSDKIHNDNLLLKKFLYVNMYKHPFVVQMTESAKIVVKDLFNIFTNDYKLLPEDWKQLISGDKYKNIILISDYLSGMTDRYA